jgi:hypothetical protein
MLSGSGFESGEAVQVAVPASGVRVRVGKYHT